MCGIRNPRTAHDAVTCLNCNDNNAFFFGGGGGGGGGRELAFWVAASTPQIP